MTTLVKVGGKFGALTVVGKGDKLTHATNWACKCVCGKEISVRTTRLVHGQKSCGCLTDRSKVSTCNGLSRTKLYWKWHSMIARCKYKSNNNYNNYGGRGISVCKEWKSYLNFLRWARISGYAEGLSLDRVDFNGNYCPSNCRFVDNITQQNNKRTNALFNYLDKTMTLAQWSRELNISRYKTKKFLEEVV